MVVEAAGQDCDVQLASCIDTDATEMSVDKIRKIEAIDLDLMINAESFRPSLSP